MTVKKLYVYQREDGGTTVSTLKPDTDYTEEFRLIADEGKVLTNGEITTSCIDVENTEGWYEIDEPTET